MNSSDLIVGTVDKKGRICVRGAFNKGQSVIFLERDGKILLADGSEVLGCSQVDDGYRVFLPKDVKNKLSLTKGDLYSLEKVDGEVVLSVEGELNKVVGVVHEKG